MARSTMPAAKAAVAALLATRFAGTGVLASYGMPLATPPPEWVWLKGMSGTQEAASMGSNRARKETYTIDATASVVKPAGSQQSATERAYALMGEVEDALRDDPTLGGLVAVAQLGGSIQLTEAADSQQDEARLDFQVDVMARI